MTKCGMKCEVFSRVVGYHRAINQWNNGKRAEFADRVEFDEKCSCASDLGNRGRPKTMMEMKNKFTF